MKFQLLIATIAFSAASVLARECNCKCQDPSGTGPQWNDATSSACGQQLGAEDGGCFLNKMYHGNQHHQCSSSSCCIDGGAFSDWCKSMGAPGAFCWH